MSIASVQKSQVELIMELEPVAERELNRHLAIAEEWFPHQYVPWGQGRDFDGPLAGSGWTPEDSKVGHAAREALLVNLLTEDNLPGYHHSIRIILGEEGPWAAWTNQWTAEENRHGIVIRDYLTVTRAIDPVALERARMKHLKIGYTQATGTDLLRGLAYVAFQELATRVSHRNTGKASGDPICEQLMQRVAKDENLHMIFYRNALTGAFEIDPDETLCAITDVVTSFEMPGYTIDGFLRKSVAIANAGIYDLRQHHDEVVMPILRKWGVFDLTGLGPKGEEALERLGGFLEQLDGAATKFETRREERRARQAARA